MRSTDLKFTKEIRFPGSAEVVAAMLSDKAFRERVAQEAGAASYSVLVEETADGVRSVIDTSQPTDGLPGVAAKFLGSTFDIHQEEVWSSATSGRLTVSIPGKPGTVNGTVSLTEQGEETVQTVDAVIKVGIPLVGGKVETIIGSALGRVLKVQQRVGAEWLAEG
ncbi:MAG TPA: DUF2505 domain-containing protein [Nocardioides sp.]